MSRIPRKRFNGATYHVILRGNNKQNIFLCDNDREQFLRVLSKYRQRHGFQVISYVLMDNHIHLLLKTSDVDISKTMHGIIINYVKYFNNTYKRKNHLFHDRFRSIIVDSDKYLLVLSRYIHQNPVNAGIVDNIEGYNWSSYNEITSINTYYNSLVDRNILLKYFDNDINTAIRLFEEFTSSTNKSYIKDNHYNEEIENFIEENFAKQVHLDDVLYKVSKHLNSIIKDKRKGNRANKIEIKKVLAYILSKHSEIDQRQIAKILGYTSQSMVSRAAKEADKSIVRKIIS